MLLRLYHHQEALYSSDPGGIDVKAVPTYFSQLPAGASTTTFVHYAQLFRHGRFAQYDYGVLQNLVVYGSASPPDYPLHLVTSPTMLYVGDGDGFATPMDTKRLAQQLPNVIGKAKHSVCPSKF